MWSRVLLAGLAWKIDAGIDAAGSHINSEEGCGSNVGNSLAINFKRFFVPGGQR
jgi:hypothetical protein